MRTQSSERQIGAQLTVYKFFESKNSSKHCGTRKVLSKHNGCFGEFLSKNYSRQISILGTFFRFWKNNLMSKCFHMNFKGLTYKAASAKLKKLQVGTCFDRNIFWAKFFKNSHSEQNSPKAKIQQHRTS